jgi:hypothetical protein
VRALPEALANAANICASRFCSTTKMRRWPSTKSRTECGNGSARRRRRSTGRPSAASAAAASSIAGAVEPK